MNEIVIVAIIYITTTQLMPSMTNGKLISNLHFALIPPTIFMLGFAGLIEMSWRLLPLYLTVLLLWLPLPLLYSIHKEKTSASNTHCATTGGKNGR